MNRKRPPIGFGDFLRAAEALGARDPAGRKRIAALLGFDWVESANQPPAETRRMTPRLEPRVESLLGGVVEGDVTQSVSGEASGGGGVGVIDESGGGRDLWVEQLP